MEFFYSRCKFAPKHDTLSVSDIKKIDMRMMRPLNLIHTLSGRIGRVVASHAAVARSSPAEVGLIYTMHAALRGYCP